MLLLVVSAAGPARFGPLQRLHPADLERGASMCSNFKDFSAALLGDLGIALALSPRCSVTAFTPRDPAAGAQV